MSKSKTIAALLLGALALALPASAQAAAPAWQIAALANSTAAPGSTLDYRIEIRNVGSAPAQGSTQPIRFIGNLPAGLTIAAVTMVSEATGVEFNFDCSGLAVGSQAFACESTQTLPAQQEAGQGSYKTILVQASVQQGAEGLLSAEFAIEGGDASNPAATTVAPATITAAPPAFGIAAFDTATSANAAGAPFTQAAGHPYAQTTSIDFNTYKSPEPLRDDLTPVEASKDIEVELPPGFVGNPRAVGQCRLVDLAHSSGQLPEPLCPPSSQVGTTIIHTNTLAFNQMVGPIPVFNMAPVPDAPAELGFNVSGVVVILEVKVRSVGDYGLTAKLPDVSEALALAGSTFTLWGDPADPIHKPERACPGERAPWEGFLTCESGLAPRAFLREPTSCPVLGVGLPATLRTDSWVHPGIYVEKTIHTHLPKGYPYPESEWGASQGPSGCASVPFEPGFSAQPTSESPDSPSGLDVHLSVPQTCWAPEQQGSTCQSDLRNAEVELPQGMSLNPSAAGGLEACAPAQIGLITPPGQSAPIHFDEAPAACPNASKIGTVSIKTPLLEEELTGAVYLAQQGDNPFDSLLAMYLVAEGSGVVIKQAGRIELDPSSGRVKTVFEESPQLPFEDLHVSLFGGPRAALRTPPSCGEYSAQATLTPWSGNAAVPKESSFQIGEGCGGGFNPKLEAGTENPLAGQTSPFSLRLTREDGEGELGGLSATLPPGLSGYLRGIPYCPDSTLASVSETEGTGEAQEANPSCPAQSRVGTVTVGAGAGSNPFYTQSGRAYLAGPYKGAPLSLAVIAPAVAGPFDLGSVVVRNALQINPETAQITAVSDPLPTILHGIPLDLRDVRVELNRPNFTLNPTSCEPMSIGSTVTSVQGQSASPSQRFQAADCDRLAFKPKLTLKLKGKTTRRAHPALSATLTMPASGQANIARAQVTLPHAEFLDQGHIRNVCTQVQFKGAGCPTSSILGHATAYSPLLDNPLTGPVYLMSGFGHKLPDLAADLNGQIRVLLHGKIDTGPGGGIRNTFEVVPDAPVTKFVLSLKGGNKGLIQNSEDVCAHPQRATALFDAHNGKIHDTSPAIATGCKHAARRHHKRH